MKNRTVHIGKSWTEVFDGEGGVSEEFLRDILPAYMRTTRWFGAKSSKIRKFGIERFAPYDIDGKDRAFLLFVEVIFETSNSEVYFLPVCRDENPEEERGVICKLKDNSGKDVGFLTDAIFSKKFRQSLFRNIAARESVSLAPGQLRFSKGKRLRASDYSTDMTSYVLAAEQSNTTVVFDERYFLKIYRKLFRNNNPDLELTRFLSEKTNFPHSPNFAGSIEWVRSDYYVVSIGLMQEKVENRGEAWTAALEDIEGIFGRISAAGIAPNALPKTRLYKPLTDAEIPEMWRRLTGEDFLNQVKKLAVRTAELHLALASDKTDRHFNPDAFTGDYTVWLLNRVMYMYDRRFHLLEQQLGHLKGKAREYAEYLIEHKDRIKDMLLNFDEQSLNSCRIRIHGDYHLGQVLITDGDFCILDFEGEPESTIRDRKVKQPPVKDLAGLFRSYHYAVFATVFRLAETEADIERLTEIGGRLYRLIVAVSLEEYVKTATEGGLDIGYAREIDFLLRYHIFEKAIYELGYELHARPDWVIIPLKGIMQILNND